MKQVLQQAKTGEVSVTEVPPPQLLRGCVLVQVAASLVSAGTERASTEFASKNVLQKAKARPDLVNEVIGKIRRDGFLSAMRAVRSRLDQPSAPGYSSSGTVLAVADDVTDVRVGDRVACAGAGYAVHAEYASVPRLLVARMPQSVSFEDAAFSTVGAVCLHGIRTADVKLGDRVAVVGLGLLGQLTVQMLRAAGCTVLGLDILPERAALAIRMGAQAASSSTTEFLDLCAQHTGGMGVDAVLITAETPSSDPVNLAGEIARDRAVVVVVGTVGMDIQRKHYYDKELDFRISRSYGPGRYDVAYEQKGRDYPAGYVRWTETRNMDAFLQLLSEKKIDVGTLITHRFPVEQAQQAYRVITGETRDPFLGVVIQYAPSVEASAHRNSSVVLAAPAKKGRVSLGLIGGGNFAQSILLPAFKQIGSLEFTGVCSATGAHSRHVAAKFGFSFCTSDEEEILQSPRVEAVVIATRHSRHASSVVAALAHGKDTFCEKPLCLTAAELSAIVRARSSNPAPVLMVGFNRRFAPMAIRLKEFFDPIDEPLAIHYRVNAGFLPRDHWTNDPEEGGGRILGELCHFVDFLSFIAGAPIAEVQARAVANPGQYSGDNLIVAVRFANGSEGTITYLANGDRTFSKERVEVFGGGSVAVLDGFRQLELVRNGRKVRSRSCWSQDKGHRSELQAFVEAVQRKIPAPQKFETLVETTLATILIQQSAATGQALPVDVAAFVEAAENAVEHSPMTLPQEHL